MSTKELTQTGDGGAVPDISVVIAVRNDIDGLAQTLDALDRQELSGAWFEVIVVDDASEDRTPEVALGRRGVTLLRSERPEGSYVARNRGVAAARGTCIAITDADCRPEPDWLARGLGHLREDSRRVVAGLVRMPLDSTASLAAMVDVMAHLDQERYVRDNGSAATANLFASAATFADVGPFDERLRSSGDAEWTKRAVRAGHPLVFAPEAAVVHPPRTTARSLLKKAKRVGEGARAASQAGILDYKPLYLSPRAFVPSGRARGRQRLRDNGADPGAITWMALAAAQVALVQLPQALYGLAFDVRHLRSRARRRRGSGGVESSGGAASRILVTNCVAQNGGDAAILEALIRTMREALGEAAQFVIIDDQPEPVGRLFPDLQVRPRLDATFGSMPVPGRLARPMASQRRSRLLAAAWLMGRGAGWPARLWLGSSQLAALREYRDADVVISTGGTYLVERYQISGRILELETALAIRRPLLLFTQSLGPFRRPSNRRAIRRIASGARLVLLRDERSRQNLLDVGIPGGNLRVGADGVFAFPLRPPRSTGPLRRVALSVRAWPYGDRAADTNEAYRSAIGRLVTFLVCDRGLEVTFLSTCQGVPEYWMDDSEVALQIADDLDPAVRRAVEIDRAFHTPQELIKRLTRFDLVIATRMHMAILALVAGVPVFPIAYEFKTQELFERLGLGEWVYTFDGVGAPGFPGDVGRFIDELPRLSGALWDAVGAEHASAAQAVVLVREALRPVIGVAGK